MKVREIYEWAKDNEVCDLVCIIEDAVNDGILSFYDDEYKLWKIVMGRRGSISGYMGVLIDESRVTGTCLKVKDTDLVYSPGIVGALSKEQRDKYCETIEEIDRPKAAARIKRWKRFVSKCKRESSGLTGIDRLRAYLECMKGVKKTTRRSR